MLTGPEESRSEKVSNNPLQLTSIATSISLHQLPPKLDAISIIHDDPPQRILPYPRPQEEARRRRQPLDRGRLEPLRPKRLC